MKKLLLILIPLLLLVTPLTGRAASKYCYTYTTPGGFGYPGHSEQSCKEGADDATALANCNANRSSVVVGQVTATECTKGGVTPPVIPPAPVTDPKSWCFTASFSGGGSVPGGSATNCLAVTKAECDAAVADAKKAGGVTITSDCSPSANPPSSNASAGGHTYDSNATTSQAATDEGGSCHWYSPGGCIKLIIAWFFVIIQWLFARILWIANEIFSYLVRLSINDFHTWVDQPAVTLAWTILRDLCNIFLIFILLYAAVGIMLDLPGDHKKIVTNLIIVALLINFSMVVPKVVIDASNILSLQFYRNLAEGETPTFLGSPDITSKLLRGLGANYDSPLESNQNLQKPQDDNLLLMLVKPFVHIIIFIVLSFLLIAAAILFLIRTLVMLFLIILSPLAFLSFATAKKKIFNDWSKKLLEQAVFAPLYLFLLYVSITFFVGASQLLTKANATTGVLESVTIELVTAAIAVGLMAYSLVAAKTWGAHGMDAAHSIAGKLTHGAVEVGAEIIGGAAGGYVAGKIMKGAKGAANKVGATPVLQALSERWKKVKESKVGQKTGQVLDKLSYVTGADKAAKGIKNIRPTDIVSGITATTNALSGKGGSINEVQDKEKKERLEKWDKETGKMSTTDKLRALGNRSEKHQNEILNKMTPADRAELIRAASTSGNKLMSVVLQTFETKLRKRVQGEKLAEQWAQVLKTPTNAKGRAKAIEKMQTENVDPDVQKMALDKINNSDLAEVRKEMGPAKFDSLVDAEKLTKIKEVINKEAGSKADKIIQEQFRTERDPDKQLATLENYLETDPDQAGMILERLSNTEVVALQGAVNKKGDPDTSAKFTAARTRLENKRHQEIEDLNKKIEKENTQQAKLTELKAAIDSFSSGPKTATEINELIIKLDKANADTLAQLSSEEMTTITENEEVAASMGHINMTQLLANKNIERTHWNKMVEALQNKQKSGGVLDPSQQKMLKILLGQNSPTKAMNKTP